MLLENPKSKVAMSLLAIVLVLSLCFLAVPHKALASQDIVSSQSSELNTQASYPYALLMSPSGKAIKQLGQKKITFIVSCGSGYANNRFNFVIRENDKNGDIVTSYPEHSLTSSHNYATLHLDAKLAAPGQYCLCCTPTFYSLYRWNETPTGESLLGYFEINGFTKFNTSVKRGKTVKLPHSKLSSLNKGSKLTFKKLSGNKNLTISKNGKLTAKKNMKTGTYKIKVASYIDGENISTKNLKIKVL